MIETAFLLLGISFVLFFGFLAEFIFKKFYIPDILFLMLLGIFVGPSVLGYIDAGQLAGTAPVFTTFALFFLVYNGAFNMDLDSIAKGIKKSVGLTFYSMIASIIVVTVIMYFATSDFSLALLSGFILCGISSAFVIPIIEQLNVKSETYSILAIESALTDVFTIVLSLTMIEIIILQTFSVQNTVSGILSLIAIAILMGASAAGAWALLIRQVFKSNKHYMLTIAYVILVYVATELVGGSGVIAVLLFGLLLRNADRLGTVLGQIMSVETKKEHEKKMELVSETERFFYSQISFFLKTFFFVYVGIVLDFSDAVVLIIGIVIALSLMAARMSSLLFTKSMGLFDRNLAASLFARGLAAAAVAQLALESGIPNADMLIGITYSVIFFTIILSSASVFLTKRMTFGSESAEEAIEASS